MGLKKLPVLPDLPKGTLFIPKQNNSDLLSIYLVSAGSCRIAPSLLTYS
jgi:hypothetical protein